MTDVEKSKMLHIRHMIDLEKFQFSPHLSSEEIGISKSETITDSPIHFKNVNQVTQVKTDYMESHGEFFRIKVIERRTENLVFLQRIRHKQTTNTKVYKEKFK